MNRMILFGINSLLIMFCMNFNTMAWANLEDGCNSSRSYSYKTHKPKEGAWDVITGVYVSDNVYLETKNCSDKMLITNKSEHPISLLGLSSVLDYEEAKMRAKTNNTKINTYSKNTEIKPDTELSFDPFELKDSVNIEDKELTIKIKDSNQVHEVLVAYN